MVTNGRVVYIDVLHNNSEVLENDTAWTTIQGRTGF